MSQRRRKQSRPIKRLPDPEADPLTSDCSSQHQHPEFDHWFNSPTCSKSPSSKTSLDDVADDPLKFSRDDQGIQEKTDNVIYEEVPLKRWKTTCCDDELERDTDEYKKSASGNILRNNEISFRRLNSREGSVRKCCNFTTDYLLNSDMICDESDHGYSESPIQRLERCVQSKKSRLLLGDAQKRKGFLTATTIGRQAEEAHIHESRCAVFAENKSESAVSDVLGELSQLVHRIGNGTRTDGESSTLKTQQHQQQQRLQQQNITGNVFTCLKCAQRFESLDGLVSHIRTTKHFSKSAAKNIGAIAPWERNAADVLLGNFCSSLLPRPNLLDIPEDLSMKQIERNARAVENGQHLI